MKRILLTIAFMLCMAFTFAQTAFTKGNLVVYRYGDGTYKDGGAYPVSAEELPVFLDEYTKAGVLVRSIALPTITIGNQRAITGIGTATQEGALSRSVDGKYLTFMGYEIAVGKTTVNEGPRVVARVSLDGTVNTATATPHRVKGSSPVVTDIATARMAVTNDGSGFWLVGTDGARVKYMPFEFNKGVAVATMENAVKLGGGGSNFAVGILANKVFYSTTNAINNFTGSLPTIAGSPAVGNALPGNAFQFVLLDTNEDGEPDLMYATEEVDNATGESRISKYANEIVVGSDPVKKAWVRKGSYYNSSINVHSKFLTVEVVGTKAMIYFTSLGTSIATAAPTTPIASALYRIENELTTDLKTSATENLTLIATAPAKTSFRGVALSPEVIVTPVKLTSFTGKTTGLNSIKLNWTTVSEKNNSHFEVLHANDGKDFNVITTINGNNNSDRLINYTFTDFKPSFGTNYYQLNQVDFDGKSEKSNIIAVDNSSNSNAFTISVTNDALTVFAASKTSATAKLIISDMSGKVVLTKSLQLTAGNNSKTVAIAQLSTGLYTGSLIVGKSSQTTKFFK